MLGIRPLPGSGAGIDSPVVKEPRTHWWFRPILAGATIHDRVLACAGTLVGIAAIALVAHEMQDRTAGDVWLLAPVGASAVLVFAVPASPLAQPWPVIGGCTISAAVGFAFGHLIDYQPLAAGLAVGFALAAMTVTRSLHPPGGAAALTAVLAVPAGVDSGPLFPLVAIAIDAVAVVLIAFAFHKLVTRHSYPHTAPKAVPAVPDPLIPAISRRGFEPEDVDAVLARIGENFDISRSDLETILTAVEAEAALRESAEHTLPR